MMRSTLVTFILLLTFSGQSQTRFSIIGKYRSSMVQVEKDTTPKLQRDYIGLPKLEVVYLIPFHSGHQLIIKRFGRFKLVNESRIITGIGSNTDYPTCYGKVVVRNDTIILQYKKAIQHHNNAAPKRRVRTKLTQIGRYTFGTNEQLLSEDRRYFWFNYKD